MNEQFTFFWRSKSPFSQWYKASFELNGITFSSAEQAMVYGKALLFKDIEIAAQILSANEPREQKRLGRHVKNFDRSIWESHCKQIVYEANKAKFSQNPELLTALLHTGETTLVEASPDDAIWGIGLAEEDPRAKHRSQWKGTNWLGEILTQLREELKRSATSL
ncbi:NADAR family protein [Brevibacillus sp. SYSU BS000544]|uniref:NADAR family protein n=1 Tax=Brevibacillus sp. SYSU BS000544 TaxID=3416443 RepID=UPI003CE48EAA